MLKAALDDDGVSLYLLSSRLLGKFVTDRTTGRAQRNVVIPSYCLDVTILQRHRPEVRTQQRAMPLCLIVSQFRYAGKSILVKLCAYIPRVVIPERFRVTLE